MYKILNKIFRLFGFQLQSLNKRGNQKFGKELFIDIKDVDFWDLYETVKPYTMTSIERLYSLYCAVNYVIKNKIDGDFVECGVWRGGCGLMIAKILEHNNIYNRKIYLYDTYEGMSEPTEFDLNPKGKNASIMMKENINNKEFSIWCYASLDDVKQNMKLAKYPLDNIIFVKGKVEDTIPNIMPSNLIALLRLDTDFYESTKHELFYLWPKLERNGVLILDDYGHWAGCRKAVDEYFMENKINYLMNRIDYTSRVIVKIK